MHIPQMIIKEIVGQTRGGTRYAWSFIIVTECGHTITLKSYKVILASDMRNHILPQSPEQVRLSSAKEVGRAYADKVWDLHAKLQEENWVGGRLLCNRCASKERRSGLRSV